MLYSADVGCIFGDKVVLHFNWVISKQATFAPDCTTFTWFGFETYLKQSYMITSFHICILHIYLDSTNIPTQTAIQITN